MEFFLHFLLFILETSNKITADFSSKPFFSCHDYFVNKGGAFAAATTSKINFFSKWQTLVEVIGKCIAISDRRRMSTDQENYIGGGIEEGSKLFDKLLLDSVKHPNEQNEPESKSVAPKPGFCLKTTTENGEKVFVNVCSSEGVLKPKEISEEELKEIWISGDATKFRIPMAIGDVHKETDKSGKECSAYDIIINPAFLEKVNKSKLFMEFFIMLVYEGLSTKHDLKLNADHVILKNRKAIGTLQMQMVRTKSTPVIMEMDQDMYEMEKEHLAEQQAAKKNVADDLRELSTKRQITPQIIPEYTIMREPPTGAAEYLIMEVKLPKYKSSKDLTLDVGEDCFVLISTDGKMKLDLDLPEIINKDETGAQFHRKTKVLTVTMPCKPGNMTSATKSIN